MIRNKEGSDEMREGYIKGEDGLSGKGFLLNIGKRQKNMQGGEGLHKLNRRELRIHICNGYENVVDIQD